MGDKHSKAARFSTGETFGDRGVVVKEPSETSKKYQEERYLKKKEPKYREVGGEIEQLQEEKERPYIPKKKSTKLRDEEADVTKPVITEDERTRRREMMKKDQESMKKKHEEENKEKMMMTSLRRKYGDYGEVIQQRIDGIVDQVSESRSDFEDIMESYMNKLTNTKLLLDEVQKENVFVGDISQRRTNMEVCVLRSNFFIANVIQSILSQRETLVFQTPDPFFKVIPMYLWRKLEKHYDNLMLIQKRYPNSESAFRSLLKESGQMEGGYKSKARKSKYEYSKYDTLTEEFNQLVNYLESVSSDVGNVSSSDTMERKYDRLIRLFSELDNDSKKNYSHMKTAIRKLKDDINELINLHTQAENVYSEMPEGFITLSTATRRGEKKRVELKRCSEELREVSEELAEIRKDLTNISASMKHIERPERGTEGSMKEGRLMDTTSRIQSIFWHLYVVKHLFIPELFTMDTDDSSFVKIKDIVRRMNFTNLFKNTYSPMDAKAVLLKYVLEVLLETNDMLDKHVEDSFAIERKDMGELESYESEGKYAKKQSKTMNKMIDDAVTKTQSNVNQMNILMNELEDTFREI